MNTDLYLRQFERHMSVTSFRRAEKQACTNHIAKGNWEVQASKVFEVFVA